MATEQFSILFLGDHNALRSQLAEALLRSRAGPEISVDSAGLTADGLHPELAAALDELGLDPGDQRAKAVAELSHRSIDLVVTVSETAREAFTPESRKEHGIDDRRVLFVGTPLRLHWDIADGKIDAVAAQLGGHVEALITQGYLEALIAERRRARLLIDALDVGIVVHDDDRRIYLFNSAAERLTGRDRSEVLGRDCHELFPPDGICGSRCAFRNEAPEPFERRDYKVAFTSHDGTGHLVQMQVTPIEVHQGRPAEVVAQVTDVTEIDQLRWQLKEQSSLHGMVGESSAMQGVFQIIRQVAASDYAVLVTGESGTGKELAARAIHSESRRAEGPFVPINCGALPEHILESELFGHVRGAFTGAIRDKKGRFELAHGGTIFLDEVGELTPSFQVKLLRVLQEMRFERVGGEREINVDVRIVSATNRDLRTMVPRREFREDLFYRLCVVPISLPPLRERRDDIPKLVGHILERIRDEMQQPRLSVSTQAMDLLLGHTWPGNVRELINALQFAAVRSGSDSIDAEHLPPEVRKAASPLDVLTAPAASTRESTSEGPRSRRKLDLDSVVAALQQTGNNKVQAAKLLGVGRATLYRFLNDNPLPDSLEK